MTEHVCSKPYVFALLLVVGCQAATPPQPEMTDAERREIVETITRLAATVDVKVDRAQFEIAESDPHVLSRDVAYLVRQGTMTFEPAAGPQAQLRYAVTHIFVRTGADWKIAHHHESFQRLEPN